MTVNIRKLILSKRSWKLYENLNAYTTVNFKNILLHNHSEKLTNFSKRSKYLKGNTQSLLERGLIIYLFQCLTSNFHERKYSYNIFEILI